MPAGAAWKAEGSDTSAVTLASTLNIVTDVPESAIVSGIHGGCGVVLPAKGAGLRGVTLCQNGFFEGEDSFWIFGEPGSKALAGKVGVAAEGVAHADVSFAIDAKARHPAIEAIRGVSSLLIELRLALSVELEFVPANASSSVFRVDGVEPSDPLVVTNFAIDEPLHELVSLSVEARGGSWLRDAFGELSVAEVVVWGDVDLPHGADGGLAWIDPVDVEFIDVDAVVGEMIVELGTSGGDHDVRRAGWWKIVSINVGVVEEVDAIEEDALLGGGQSL